CKTPAKPLQNPCKTLAKPWQNSLEESRARFVCTQKEKLYALRSEYSSHSHLPKKHYYLLFLKCNRDWNLNEKLETE
ncbi:MAG: hypothetical protein ACI3YC_08510, partial [Alloprevotella sp.]